MFHSGLFDTIGGATNGPYGLCPKNVDDLKTPNTPKREEARADARASYSDR